MTKNKKKKMKKIDAMTAALFLFSASIMMFIGVVGSAYIGKSYAVSSSSSLPQTLSVYTDETWGGKFPDGPSAGDLLISGMRIVDFYGVDPSGKRYELYCLEAHKDMPGGGTYTKDDDKTAIFADEGITYIISNSYPNDNSFMSGKSSYEKKYVTQVAIWYYQDLAKGVATSVDGELSATVKQAILTNKTYGPFITDLANRALAAKNTSVPSDALSIDQSAISYSISSDGKYFESNYIPVVGSNGRFKSYKVTLSENSYGATLVDEGGAEVPNGSLFAPSAKFKIRVPLEKLKELNKIDLSASVTGTFEHQKVYAYRHSTADAQTALVAAFDNENQDTNISLQLNIPTGKVQISKQDITNSKEVAGATLVIIDCNGKEVAKWISSTEPYYIDALPVTTNSCKYKLTETIAPEGYEINTESIEFEVRDDGTVTKVVMKDNPLTPTPDTGMDIPMVVYVTGGIILICGIAIIYASVKPKKED